jgi:hypothetical protein
MSFRGKKLSLTREWLIKKEMCEKYLKEPLGWILGAIKRALNLSDLIGNTLLEELRDHHNTDHNTVLAYWRQP